MRQRTSEGLLVREEMPWPHREIAQLDRAMVYEAIG